MCLILKNKLLTKFWLLKRGLIPDDVCVLCENVSETCAHLFFECDVSKLVLAGVINLMQVDGKEFKWHRWFPWMMKVTRRRIDGAKRRRRVVAAMVYGILHERNRRQLGTKMTVAEIVEKIGVRASRAK
ncbi:hypothetical protein Droror1_Dr00021944 [Drosera rotundifolia]